MNGGRQRDGEHPSSDTKCWRVGGRLCGRRITRRSVLENPAYERLKATQYAQREREREREAQRGITLLTKGMQQLQLNNNLRKGYKVTLYSDSLRAAALYPIYINGPNLGTQRG